MIVISYSRRFYRLFVAMLERQIEVLSRNGTAHLKNFISELFGGIYAHSTQCKQCGFKSTRPEIFTQFELPIKVSQSVLLIFDNVRTRSRWTIVSRSTCTKRFWTATISTIAKSVKASRTPVASPNCTSCRQSSTFN